MASVVLCLDFPIENLNGDFLCLRAKNGTRNQEIFGQKLADYAVDCLWIFSYSNAISRGKMTCII